jgi:hypothetical protein
MKVRNREELILALISRVITKGEHYIWGESEPMGEFVISGGTRDRVKKDGTPHKNPSRNNGQYIKGKFAIPHEAIKDKYVENVAVFNDSFHMPTVGIHLGYASDKLVRVAAKQDKWWEEYSGKRPRLAAAVKELIAAVEEELKNEKERAKDGASK